MSFSVKDLLPRDAIERQARVGFVKFGVFNNTVAALRELRRDVPGFSDIYERALVDTEIALDEGLTGWIRFRDLGKSEPGSDFAEMASLRLHPHGRRFSEIDGLMHGQAEAVDEFLEKVGFDPNLSDQRGYPIRRGTVVSLRGQDSVLTLVTRQKRGTNVVIPGLETPDISVNSVRYQRQLPGTSLIYELDFLRTSTPLAAVNFRDLPRLNSRLVVASTLPKPPPVRTL